MTQEVVVVAEAALANGYDQVIVCDSHGNTHYIEPDLLPDDVWLVRGWPRPLLHMQGVEDPAYAPRSRVRSKTRDRRTMTSVVASRAGAKGVEGMRSGRRYQGAGRTLHSAAAI